MTNTTKMNKNIQNDEITTNKAMTITTATATATTMQKQRQQQ